MKPICLGTALWGWGVDKENAFSLLDNYYSSGNRYIDSAFNYPINNKKEDFYSATNYLSEWISVNKVNDLKIIYKVGSLSNNLSTLNNLENSFLTNQASEAMNALNEKNIESIMIHWDHTTIPYEENHFCDFINFLDNKNIHLGLSGVDPEVYKGCDLGKNNIYIESKFNLFYDTIHDYHSLLKKKAFIFAYGISVSGIKFAEEDYDKNSYVTLARSNDFHKKVFTETNLKKLEDFKRKYPFIKNMYHAGMLLCETSEKIDGFIIGPRNIKQLKDIEEFRKIIQDLIN